MLKSILYGVMHLTMQVRGWIIHLCGRFAPELTDKQLYAVLAGAAGIGIYLLLHPVIRNLARRGREAVISWAFTLTVLMSLIFGLEISRLMTGTGSMEPADVLFCIAGFLVLFALYSLVCWIGTGLGRWIRKMRR